MLSRTGQLKRIKCHVDISFVSECKGKYEKVNIKKKNCNTGTFSNEDVQNQGQDQSGPGEASRYSIREALTLRAVLKFCA